MPSIRNSCRTAATVALSLAFAISHCDLPAAASPFQKPSAPATGGNPSVAQLAVQVRLDGRGVTALEGRVLTAPSPVDDSPADLEIITRAADGTPLRQYAIRDPRRQQPEADVWRGRRSATTVVYVPLTDSAKTLQIRPAKARPNAPSTLDTAWRGGIIQLKPLLLSACRSHRDVPECVRVLQARD